jgi:hypothetical protein
MDTYSVKVIAGVAGGNPVEKDYTPDKGSFGYLVDDPKTPNCLKFYWGRKTVIVPMQNLILVELDL